MLLVVAVKAAEQNAEREDDENIIAQQEKLVQLNQAIETQELLAQSILEQRTLVQQELASARKKRGHIEEQVRLLEQQLKTELSELESVIQKRLPALVNADTHEQGSIELLQARLAQRTQELEKLKDFAAQTIPKYQITIGPSKNGTSRLPIFVECTPTEIIFQPSNVKLKPGDFQLPLGPGNPVDSALLAIREYYSRSGLTNHGEPYPLIVVRPGGEASYAIVRKAMLNWDDEFGYELVEAERKVDFGPVDEGAAEIVKSAIAYSRQRSIRQQIVRGPGKPGISSLRSGIEGNGSTLESATSGSPNNVGNDQIVSGSRNNSYALNNSGGITPNQNKPDRLGPAVQSSTDNNRTDHQPIGNSHSLAGMNVNNGMNSGSTELYDRNAGKPAVDANDGQTSAPSSLVNSINNSQKFRGQQTQNQSLQTYVRDAKQWYQGHQNNRSRQGESFGNQASKMGAKGTGNCSCLADSRGQNWALPSVRSNGTAYRRPVFVQVTSRGFGIPTGQEVVWIEVADLDPKTLQTGADKLVRTVWDIIDSWGYAGADSYWKPELQIKVHPGGEERFSMLSQLLGRSGLDVKRTNDQ